MTLISRTFVATLERFVVQHEIPLVQFRKGQRKDTVMAEHLGKFHPDCRRPMPRNRRARRSGNRARRSHRWRGGSARRRP
jgi:hypothetical protein